MNTTEDFGNLPVPETLLEATRMYADEEFCIRTVVAMRWGKEPICHHCGGVGAWYITTERIFKCKQCRKRYSAKAGSIFEKSPISLDKWLVALWLIANSKNGISSYELGRHLGLTQKSAWFVLHRLRLVTQAGSFEKMTGEVEADETFVGGKAKNMHYERRKRVIGDGRGSVGKTIVMGILERGREYVDKNGEVKKTTSRIKANVIKDTTAPVLQGEIAKTVEPGTSVYTDAARGYDGLIENYEHAYIDHALKYVEGRISTNGCENFWCLLDRTITGTYTNVAPSHLPAYVDEQAFRFNERGLKDGGRFVKMMKSISGKRLTYDDLTGQETREPLRGGGRAD